jgi:hypothetical protein
MWIREINESFFTEIRQRDVVQEEFSVWAVIIDCNRKEVPINSIIKSRTQSLKLRIRFNIILAFSWDWGKPRSIVIACFPVRDRTEHLSNASLQRELEIRNYFSSLLVMKCTVEVDAVTIQRTAFKRNWSMYSINSLRTAWKFCWTLSVESKLSIGNERLYETYKW